MKKQYDVIVIGAGPAGIFACCELTRKAPGLDVLLIDKGRDIYGRKCPISEKKITKCPHEGNKEFASCRPACSMTSGFGGAGRFGVSADGKRQDMRVHSSHN